ncbi:MAG: succinyl-diaminopimelate desuccinylase [Arsenophonus endosymbiont of Ceratovacuna japonica]
MNCPIIQLAQQLIKIPSISPNDYGCQKIIIDRFKKYNFLIEIMSFNDTTNLWAYHGKQGKTLAFIGHTDVVTAGVIKDWSYNPFIPTINNGFLYGRGSADMKGSLASMIVAAERFINTFPNHIGRLAFLITSDEESKAINGTKKVINELIARNEQIDYCIVGEPSSNIKLGDIIKHGRRGSLTAKLTIKGTQGHIAYSHLANNPIHSSLPFLNELINKKWDNGNIFFPPTSVQIFNINAGIGNSNNVIPGELVILFNFRFNTELNEEKISKKVKTILKKYKLDYKIEWSLSGHPFLTKKNELIDITSKIIKLHCGYHPKLLTDGGISDGRFLSQIGAQVIELGPLNKTIHKINECINIIDLQQLSIIYQQIMQKILLI